MADAATPLILLQAFSLGGAKLCEFRVGAGARVDKVKQQISLSCGIPAGEQRLVLAGDVLRNDHTLEECNVRQCIVSHRGDVGVVSVQCIRCGQCSRLSRNLTDLAGSGDAEVHYEAAMGAVADAVLRSEHQLSERLRPTCPQALLRATRNRLQCISWMMQAFDILSFDPGVLYGAVLTLDRFFMRRSEPVDPASMGEYLLACVSIEMKLASEQVANDFLCLSRRRVDMRAVFTAECEILSCVDFDVGVPTTYTFVQQLLALPRCDDPALLAAVPGLAMFFLDLCLSEPALQYSHYPHCVLAGGVLAAALRVLDAGTGCCDDLREQLHESLQAYDVKTARKIEVLVFECEEDIVELWCACARGEGNCDGQAFYSTVVGRYEHGRCGRAGDVAVVDPATAAATLDRLRQVRANG